MLHTPRCEVAQRCGGCPLIEHELSEQHRVKERVVRAALSTAGVVWKRPIAWSWSTEVGYRNRIRLELARGRPRFFNPHKLHSCAVLRPELQALLTTFERWSANYVSILERFSHLELRVPDADGMAGLELVSRDASEAASLGKQLEGPLAELAGWASFVRGAGAAPLQRFQLTDDVFAFVPVGAFMQVNSSVNRLLIEQIRAGACARGIKSFIDLYCGSGNLSLPLLKSEQVCVQRGRGVELEPSAIDALERALGAQRLQAGPFVAGDALTIADGWVHAGVRADLVIVDPPRAGLHRRVEALVELAERAIALCYCSVRAFASDVQRLLELGCTLQELHALDMFPHTSHMELLAWLSPPGSPGCSWTGY